MHLPEPYPMSFSTLIADIEKGLIKIPQFQRDFVWPRERSAKLIDSIVKGYPIGTFILWKTKEELRHIRNLGNISLPPTPKGDFINYVLDGQQRMTSLFACLKGLEISRNGVNEDFREMFLDLATTEHDQVVVTDVSNKEPNTIVRIVDLIEGGAKLYKKYPEQFHERLDLYRDRIRTYTFSAILVKEAPIDVATEIFTRINVGGKPLSVFEIMVAKTFDADKNFDLAEKYSKLIKDLEDVNYETISDATVLQVISCVLTKECQKRHILALNKKDVIDVWAKVDDAIKQTIDYFRVNYHVPVSKLLPYNALIVPFSYFFYHHTKKPVGDVQQYLRDFFWRTSLGGRYSSAVEGKIAQDLKRMDSILKGKLPIYDYPVDVSPKFIMNNGFFSVGRSYIKAILCIYASHHPKSFNSEDAVVRISNDWLKQANSRNYHHFFPRAYLEKRGVDNKLANHVLNITIVDDYLNKREIGAKAPSQYMKKFSKENAEIHKTMRSHLVDIDRFGIWEDDYEKFLDKRAKWVSRELSKRITPQDVDASPQAIKLDDYEEIETETKTIETA